MPAGKTNVYAISVTVDASGAQRHAIVFRKPAEGYAYPKGSVIAFNEDGSSWSPANDDGVLPHRERTSDDEDLGLTWQFSK